MTYKFKHEYWGEEWQDPSDKLYLGKMFFSAQGVARAVGETFFNEGVADDPESFETFVEVMDEHGIVKKFQVQAEISIDFEARERKGSK